LRSGAISDLEALPPISDCYSDFVHGVYKTLTLGHRYYRPIGADPAPSSATEMRENINETIDSSVFERWRAGKNYRPPNLSKWLRRRGVDPAAIKTNVMADTGAETLGLRS
jgi:hypothetical protein